MIPLLVFGLVLVGLLVRYVQLRHRLSDSESEWMACRTHMLALGQELARYAFSHQGVLPDDLGTVLKVVSDEGSDCQIRYRHVPELDRDKRLILAYDGEPRHLLMQFPRLAVGRNVLFASGKVELFAEEAVHQLVVGDNVLRSRLNLPELPFLEVRDGGE